MYGIGVMLLMLVLPVGSVLAELGLLPGAGPLMLVVGKWFVFWSVGVRLFVAGLRQVLQPRFTSEEIFDIQGDDALPLVRELGVANVAMGVVGLASLAKPTFILPAAVAAGIFYGVAGARHLAAHRRTRNENIAMVSDLFVSVILAAYVVFVALT